MREAACHYLLLKVTNKSDNIQHSLKVRPVSGEKGVWRERKEHRKGLTEPESIFFVCTQVFIIKNTSKIQVRLTNTLCGSGNTRDALRMNL